MIIGEQSLADPLRYLIEERVSMAGLRSVLQTGGQPLHQALSQLWLAKLAENR